MILIQIIGINLIEMLVIIIILIDMEMHGDVMNQEFHGYKLIFQLKQISFFKRDVGSSCNRTKESIE